MRCERESTEHVTFLIVFATYNNEVMIAKEAQRMLFRGSNGPILFISTPD